MSESENKNLKILFTPFFIGLFALAAYRYNSDFTVETALRAPAAVSVSVSAALKTVLQITGSDIDKMTTAKIQKEIVAGSLPESLKYSSPQIIEKLKNGNMKFYSFQLLDSGHGDDDTVEIFIDGQLLGSINISKKSSMLSVPIEFGKSKIITIKALRDSGKGVIFGAKLVNSDFILRNLQVGESETIYLGYEK